MFLLSLNEVDRVKRLHSIGTMTELQDKTNITRKTWTKALKTRRPTPDVLNALSDLGARASRVLVYEADPAA